MRKMRKRERVVMRGEHGTRLQERGKASLVATRQQLEEGGEVLGADGLARKGSQEEAEVGGGPAPREEVQRRGHQVLGTELVERQAQQSREHRRQTFQRFSLCINRRC